MTASARETWKIVCVCVFKGLNEMELLTVQEREGGSLTRVNCHTYTSQVYILQSLSLNFQLDLHVLIRLADAAADAVVVVSSAEKG